MEGQTSIPVPEEPRTGICAWSDPANPCAPATSKIEMLPAVKGKNYRAAIRSWARDKHLRSLRPSERAAKQLVKDTKKAGGKRIVIR